MTSRSERTAPRVPAIALHAPHLQWVVPDKQVILFRPLLYGRGSDTAAAASAGPYVLTVQRPCSHLSSQSNASCCIASLNTWGTGQIFVTSLSPAP